MAKYRFQNVGELNDTIRRVFFLAWKACGSPQGMGMFQDRGPGMTEDPVWDNIARRGDYPGGPAIGKPPIDQKNGIGDAYADYVFGRMMKLSVQFNFKELTLTISDSTPRWDYQAWCGTYKTYDALVDAATKELNYGAEILV